MTARRSLALIKRGVDGKAQPYRNVLRQSRGVTRAQDWRLLCRSPLSLHSRAATE